MGKLFTLLLLHRVKQHALQYTDTLLQTLHLRPKLSGVPVASNGKLDEATPSALPHGPYTNQC